MALELSRPSVSVGSGEMDIALYQKDFFFFVFAFVFGLALASKGISLSFYKHVLSVFYFFILN